MARHLGWLDGSGQRPHPPRGVRPPGRPLARPGPDRLGGLLVPARRGGRPVEHPGRLGAAGGRGSAYVDRARRRVRSARLRSRCWTPAARSSPRRARRTSPGSGWRASQPDTAYRYRIRVDGREWAPGQRWDWVPTASGGYDLGPGEAYDLGFRTFPAPDSRDPARCGSSRWATTASGSSRTASPAAGSAASRRCSTSSCGTTTSASCCRWATTSTRASRGRWTTRAAGRTTTGTPASSSPTAT